MKPMTIPELVAARIEAKRAEDAAIAARRELDEQISLQLSAGKAEGTESLKMPDMGVKVTVTYKVSRKVDSDKLSAAWANLSASEQAAFKWAPDVSVTGLRKLEGDSLIAVSKFITTNPAAPSVKVELI